MFRTDSLLGRVGPILALQWPKNDWKWWFPTIAWKSMVWCRYNAVYFLKIVKKNNTHSSPRYGMSFVDPASVWYSSWVPAIIYVISYYIGPHYTGTPLYSRNPIQIWCVHLLGDCSKVIRFWATLVKFWLKKDLNWWFPTVIWKSVHTI